MSSIQATKATKKKVNPSTLSSTVKAHEDLYYICLNFKEMLPPMINESRSGTDLGSHQVVLPGIRSCLYSEHGTEAVGSPWCLGGMRHSSGCALPRAPHLPVAFPRSSSDWHRPQEPLWPLDVHHSVLVLTGHGVAMSIFWKILSYTCFLLLPLCVFSLVLLYSEEICTYILISFIEVEFSIFF